MEIDVMPGDNGLPASTEEILHVLKSQDFDPRLELADWGDWIHLQGYASVISLDLERSLVNRAVLEIDEADPDHVKIQLFTAFHQLNWVGEDDDGPFRLA